MVVDGNDVVSVFVAAKAAAEKARQDSEPVFLECLTYKMKGHGVYDKAEYRPKDEVAKWLERDPIKMLKERLLKRNLMTQTEIGEVENATRQEIEEAVEFATQSSPLPFSEIKNYVYAEEQPCEN
jgi:TPP-dependent pyruvate/acetoin dehydrogenase alpha subunit